MIRWIWFFVFVVLMQLSQFIFLAQVSFAQEDDFVEEKPKNEGSAQVNQEPVAAPAYVYKRHRPYPGGRDEEDLKVRSSMPAPLLTVDRRGIEQQVLKNYLKKTEEASESRKKTR